MSNKQNDLHLEEVEVRDKDLRDALLSLENANLEVASAVAWQATMAENVRQCQEALQEIIDKDL